MIEDYAQPETLEALKGVADLLREDYQRLWLGTGENRVGKSTFALDVCDYLSRCLNSRIWISFFFRTYVGEEDNIKDIRRDLGLEKTNIFPASTQFGQEHGNMYDIHDIDEAVRSLHMGRSLSHDAMTFLINYDIFGKRRYFYYMIMPEFEFTKGFRERRAHMWVDVPKRGVACFYKPKRVGDHKEFPKSPMWVENFQPLEKERQEIYEQVKEYMLRLSLKLRDSSTKDNTEAICLRIRELYPKATIRQIAYIVGISKSNVGRILQKHDA